jgi:phosphoribosyl-dephospho-CoA transferase
LLALANPSALAGDLPAPDWVAPALAAAPWVVVRRVPPLAPGLVGVGVRGSERHQRWAAWLPLTEARLATPPEAVADLFALRPPSRRLAIPALAAVPLLAAILARLGLSGGPTGSVGFELVSGQPAANPNSDLDAIVRADSPMPHPLAEALSAEIAGLAVRCDMLMETPHGAVALAEYARTPGAVVLRGPRGPRLVADPWDPALAEDYAS